MAVATKCAQPNKIIDMKKKTIIAALVIFLFNKCLNNAFWGQQQQFQSLPDGSDVWTSLPRHSGLVRFCQKMYKYLQYIYVNYSTKSLHIRIDDNNGDHEERPDGQVDEVNNGSELDELVDLPDHEKGFTKYLQDGTNGHQVNSSSSNKHFDELKNKCKYDVN